MNFWFWAILILVCVFTYYVYKGYKGDEDTTKVEKETPQEKRLEVERTKTYYCKMCGKKNATEHKVGPMNFYVCSQNCANILYNSVVAKGISQSPRVMVNGNTGKTDIYASAAYFCYWCGSNMGTEFTRECLACGGVQEIK